MSSIFRHQKAVRKSITANHRIEVRILTLRGVRVMLGGDLAALYGVTAKRLNERVKRKTSRFPNDFIFRLTEEEFRGLRSQIATSKRGGSRYAPYAFTEQGVAMLSSVLDSRRAIAVNIEIMRAFVRLRRFHGEYVELARKIDELEAKYDRSFKVVFDAIKQLMQPPRPPGRALGFRPERNRNS